MNLWRLHKYYYLRFLRLRGNPRALAGGTAIGVFVGLTPTIPLHTVLIILLTFATRSSTIAGIIVSWIVSNPLTSLPLYYCSTVVGNKLTPYTLDLDKLRTVFNQVMHSESFKNSVTIIWDLGYEAIMVLVVGGVVLAFPFAVVSYYLALHFFVHIQLTRKKKHILD